MSEAFPRHEIMKAGPAHLPILAVLHATCFPERPWTEEELADVLALPGCVALLALSGPDTELPAEGLPVGFIIARRAADEAEIISLGVAPAARGAGYGRSLLSSLRDRLVAAGVGQLFLEVAADNSAAITLYEAFGFDGRAKRSGYYTQGRTAPVDGLVMVLDMQD